MQGVRWSVYGGYDLGGPKGVLLQVRGGHGRIHPQTFQGLLLHHLPRPRGRGNGEKKEKKGEKKYYEKMKAIF